MLPGETILNSEPTHVAAARTAVPRLWTRTLRRSQSSLRPVSAPA
jgi:hypothetical protein